MQIVTRSAQLLLDLLFPRKCVACKAEGAWICPQCQAAVAPKFLFEPVTPSIFGLFSMEEIVIREAVHALKYNSIYEAAYALVDTLALATTPQQLRTAWGVKSVQGAFVPVPVSNKRRKSRGYNQAELLAEAFSPWLGMPIEYHLLERAQGKTLVGSNRAQRQLQTFHAFALAENARVNAQTAYILIDDVVTTGSTLKVCRHVLREVGAQNVVGCAFAYRHLDNARDSHSFSG